VLAGASCSIAGADRVQSMLHPDAELASAALPEPSVSACRVSTVSSTPLEAGGRDAREVAALSSNSTGQGSTRAQPVRRASEPLRALS